jgi:ferredoxin
MEIYYFSGTGNSLYAAREIQKAFPDSKLVAVNVLAKKETIITNSDVVGFIFPIYGFGLPAIMENFFRRIDLRTATYLFAVATRGGSPSTAPKDIQKIMARKGKILNSFFYLGMPNNSFFVHEFNTQERIKEKFEQARIELSEIAETVKTRKDNRTVNQKINLFNGLLFRMLRLIMNVSGFFGSGNAFYVDEQCTQCGTCESVCLSKRITVKNAAPHFSKDTNCRLCLACVNYCPVGAIHNRRLRVSKINPGGQYHHPEITAKDIGQQKEFT